MRLILSEYLRTLRERDELDRLLPDLLVAMGYVPLSKPQTGVRQFGVDLAAVGKSPDDEEEELVLVVVKQGDIGRRDWSNGEPTAIRPTLDEILDAYLPAHVSVEHEHLRKTIVLATTGGIKQDTELNWKGYRQNNAARAKFEFWGGDRIAGLIERYMLNENVFAEKDRSDLRKALALSSDRDYDFKDLCRLFLRQLGLQHDGTVIKPKLDISRLVKALRRVHLAAQICAHWAENEGNRKQALWISERALLWAWHRLRVLPEKTQIKALSATRAMLHSYLSSGISYYQGIQPHLSLPDGLAVHSRESIEFSMVLFDNLGQIATVGLSWLLLPESDSTTNKFYTGQAQGIANGLAALIMNNHACASPRFDGHIIDIVLALLLLKFTGYHQLAEEWVTDMVYRLDYCLTTKRHFPVDSDSMDDLVALETTDLDEEQRGALMRTSWCLATLAAWCALLGLEPQYERLASGNRETYPQTCAQLWHPTTDWQDHWYFGHARDFGESEAPFALPTNAEDLRQRLKKFTEMPQYQWNAQSRTGQIGLSILDFVACRHFRIPVPASLWYRACELTPPTPGEEPTAG